MLEKIQDYIILKTDNHELAYIITCIIYLIITFGGLFLVGLIFGYWWQLLVIAVLMSVMRNYTMGFHAHDNLKCFIISSIVLVMFSVLSEYMPIWAVFLLTIYSCCDIYKKAPIELNNDYKDKDSDWHFKRVVIIMAIYLFIGLISYRFQLYDISKCFLLSICLVNLLLFKNDKEFI